MDELLKKYVHQNWDDISDHRNDKYYFVQASDDIENIFSEVQYQLEVAIPEELRTFYKMTVSRGGVRWKKKITSKLR